MNFRLCIWRQADADREGAFKEYEVRDVSPDSSFLEMLDLLNERLMETREEAPIAFDHDCREGICGMCGMLINGMAHGPVPGHTVCQLHMRHFEDGAHIVIEPWRARSFPVIQDLVVNRGTFDRIIESGGYVSFSTGTAPEANTIPIPQSMADRAMDAAACIGCGACVAACPNGSAMLFTAAKIGHLANLPQGQPERSQRVVNMVTQMDAEGFGGCTNMGACTVVCPKEISQDFISQMNKDYRKAVVHRVNPTVR